MSGRETIVRRQKNWREKLETAPTWREIGVVAVKAGGIILALAGWCWLSDMMPSLIQGLMLVPVAVLSLLIVVYGVPLAALALGMLCWALSRDAVRLYDAAKARWRVKPISPERPARPLKYAPH